MPRRPKFIHPVRQVRQAVGEARGRIMTQPEFAREVGSAGETIKAIENGKLKLSEELASRISRAFYVNFDSLLTAKGPAKNLVGTKNFTAATYNTSKATFEVAVNRYSEKLIEKTLDSVRTMMRAAHRKGRLLPVWTSLAQYMMRINEEYSICPTKEAVNAFKFAVALRSK